MDNNITVVKVSNNLDDWYMDQYLIVRGYDDEDVEKAIEIFQNNTMRIREELTDFFKDHSKVSITKSYEPTKSTYKDYLGLVFGSENVMEIKKEIHTRDKAEIMKLNVMK